MLAETGYVEGRNLAIEWRWGEGAVDRLPLLAAELVRIPVDALIVFGNEAVQTAMNATTTLPIVMVGASNPVELRFIESLSRPGANVTGTAYNPTEVAGKQKVFEKYREGIGRKRRIDFLFTMPMTWAQRQGCLRQELFGRPETPSGQTACDHYGVLATYRIDGSCP